jgi:hypothetical protein
LVFLAYHNRLVDIVRSLFAEHALLALVMALVAGLTLFIGVLHEVRLLLDILTVVVRSLKREFHEWSLLLRTGNGDAETLLVDTKNVESVRQLIRVLKKHDAVEASTTDK